MKILLLGATGNLGSRLIPALLTHHHSVVAFVRSAQKLESLLPPPVYQRLTIIQGDAKNATAVRDAITESGVDAVVSAAGVAALPPWGKSDLPEIFGAVLRAVREAGEVRGRPLRVWMLGGTSVLCFPGTGTLLSSFIPIYLEHRHSYALLRSLPPDTVDWSLLCPNIMTPESSDLSVPTKASQETALVAAADMPPLWRHSWVESIPLGIGKTLSISMNIGRYPTTLEQNAEFVASDLETRDSKWIGKRVGVVDGRK